MLGSSSSGSELNTMCTLCIFLEEFEMCNWLAGKLKTIKP